MRWPAWLMFGIVIPVIAGCAHSPRQGVISQQLPITVDDLTEIREGKRNHERVLWDYRVYYHPELQGYCNNILRNIAVVSERPNLPYQVILLDSEDVQVFAGPGGYIYITRGFFDFIQSEGELAGAMAHEVVHVANFQYAAIPHLSKVQVAYHWAVQGSEFAKSSIGSYGTAANMGLKGVGRAAPALARRFGKDEEIETDEKAVDALVKAGYDPRGYLRLVDKLTKIDMADLEKFAVYMAAHPPFAERVALLTKKIEILHLEEGKIILKQDALLSEVPSLRGAQVNGIKKSDSIIFKSKIPLPEAAVAVQ